MSMKLFGFSLALVLGTAGLVLASSYGGNSYGQGPPQYPQRYQKGQYSQGSGRPQYQQKQQRGGYNQKSDGYGQSQYEQQSPYGQGGQQQDQYSGSQGGYSYDQKPLYPEQSYETPEPTVYQPETTVDPGTTTTDPGTTTAAATSTTTPQTTTAAGTTVAPTTAAATTTAGASEATTTAGASEATTTAGASEATTASGASEATTASGASEATTESGATEATPPTPAGLVPGDARVQAVTQAPGARVQAVTQAPEARVQAVTQAPGAQVQAVTQAPGAAKVSAIGCPDIPTMSETCVHNASSVSLAVDCSVVGTAGLLAPTGVCASSCTKGANKVVEYTYNSIDVPDFQTAITNKNVGLVVTCPDATKFCTCSTSTCCTLAGSIGSVTYLPHCTGKVCENILFIGGTGTLTCNALKGGGTPLVIDALTQLKNSTLGSTLLARGLTSVSCNGCDTINKQTTCVSA
ncbi:hypothetical protein M3Y97_01022800 [Aphelenchoides bicaudatus]|nr:hypothetical protein M3Y97_01022800 [Aphelenchoides bicaudatus]